MASTPESQDSELRNDRRIVAYGLGMILLVGLLLFIPNLVPSSTHAVVSDLVHARIVSVAPVQAGEQPSATVVILDGSQTGARVTAVLQGPSSQLQLPDYRAGDEVVVSIDHQPGSPIAYDVVDRWRLPLLGVLAAAFVLVAAAIAGWRGLRAVVSLVLTIGFTIRLLIPLLLLGWDPVALAVVFGIAVTALSFLLTQGPTRTTLAAIIGTSSGLLITGVLAAIVTAAAQFTSAQGSEEIVTLAQLAGNRIDLSGLLLAAVIFGGLGVLNDVAMSQAATVEELAHADPTLDARALYARAMNVGVAHLAATINTLVFAYLGTALPLLVILSIQVSSLGDAVNQEVIAVEVVRTLVGSLGILAAVPLTTAITAAWQSRETGGEASPLPVASESGG
ncbi:MAG: YibE/F family protein [Candidatus Limnocylindrales bacterium]|jgi:uncharacterized membrane protein